jgi:hypothetical protein
VWLRPYVRKNQPKFLTKAELRDAAIRELKVSKNSFDFAWTEVIERTCRYDGMCLCDSAPKADCFKDRQ